MARYGLGNAVFGRRKGTMAGQSPLSMMRADRGRVPSRGAHPATAPDRRAAPSTRGHGRRHLLAAFAGLVVLAGAWCGLWYYAAAVASRTLAGWVGREAAAGRVYTCGSEGISGFPFRIQAHCVKAAAALNSVAPPVSLAADEITFTAQVYHPTVLVGEVTGPLTMAAPGQPASLVATWSLARMSVSGVPPNPDAVSITIEQPHLDRDAGAGAATLFAAGSADLQARIVGGTADHHPVIDAVLHFSSASAPTVHQLLSEPLQGDVEVVLRGFRDLSPKPFAERFREMQAAGGSIEIKSLRIARADAIVIGSGKLNVNAEGRLDGVISIAVSGLDSIVPQLGIDQMIGKGIDRLAGGSGSASQGLSALDRLMPGLSGVVSAGANASVVDDLKKMGQPTEIDQKPATALPLRFTDGAIYLGIIRIGAVPALF
jgi:hypothetical protein